MSVIVSVLRIRAANTGGARKFRNRGRFVLPPLAPAGRGCHGRRLNDEVGEETAMPPATYTRPTASMPPAGNPLLAPQPPIAPLTPPVHVVDLMTEAGSAAFGARWRGMEAKLVVCPALSDSMPE